MPVWRSRELIFTQIYLKGHRTNIKDGSYLQRIRHTEKWTISDENTRVSNVITTTSPPSTHTPRTIHRELYSLRFFTNFYTPTSGKKSLFTRLREKKATTGAALGTYRIQVRKLHRNLHHRMISHRKKLQLRGLHYFLIILVNRVNHSGCNSVTKCSKRKTHRRKRWGNEYPSTKKIDTRVTLSRRRRLPFTDSESEKKTSCEPTLRPRLLSGLVGRCNTVRARTLSLSLRDHPFLALFFALYVRWNLPVKTSRVNSY